MALESITILDLDIIIIHNRLVGQNSLKFEENEEKKTFLFRGEEGTKDVFSITLRVPIAFKPCHEPSPKKSASQPPDLKIIFGFAAGRELVEL